MTHTVARCAVVHTAALGNTPSRRESELGLGDEREDQC